MSHVQVSTYDLNHVVRDIGQIRSTQLALSNQIDEVSATQAHTNSELSELRSIIDQFVRRDQLAKALQLAQTQIIEERQLIESEYGHYEEVRRFATGLLQAADTGIVTTSSMRQLSEELMLTAPRYWLAPAVIALASWIRNDRPLAERALTESLRRDANKATLLFALVLRRYRRGEATARWLTQYVDRQNPGSLEPEFTVVLDAVATGALGTEVRPMVMEHVAEWFTELNADPEIREGQVARWEKLIDGMRVPVGGRFRVLPEVSPTWSRLKDAYEGASVHNKALAHFESLFDGDLSYSRDQRERVDNILTSLVTNYDAEERPRRKRLAELEVIIAHEGDKDAAGKAMAEEDPVHEERVDFLTLLTNAAFFPDKVGASAGTQRMATAMAREWISEAGGRLASRSRQDMPNEVDLKIDNWKGRLAANSTEKGLVSSLSSHIDAETRAAVAKVRFTGWPMFAAIAAGIALLLAVVMMASGSVGGGIFVVLIAAAAGGWAFYNYQGLPKRRAAIERHGATRKANGVARLNGAIAETIDLHRDWEGQLATAPKLHAYVSHLSDIAFMARPADERRTVSI